MADILDPFESCLSSTMDEDHVPQPRLFRTRTTALLLTGAFFHSFCYYTAAFYLPLYFQVLGASATRAGELVLPYALTLSALSAGIGYVLAILGDYRPIIWVSWVRYLGA